MDERDKLTCWRKLVHKYPDDEDYSLGCIVCAQPNTEAYFHADNPYNSGCECKMTFLASHTTWRGDTGFVSCSWPTCTKCIEKEFDIIEVSKKISYQRMFFFADCYECILAKKLRPVRNCKKAYK